MECEDVTQATCAIELRKSVSIYGVNGRAELRCERRCKFFRITSRNSSTTQIKFANLALSNSNTVVVLEEGTRSELIFQNMLVNDNLYALYSKYSAECSVFISSSSFDNNVQWGIHLRCDRLNFYVNSSIFNRTPVQSLTNSAEKRREDQKLVTVVQNTIFNGKNIPICVSMFVIQPFAAIFNVTIANSLIKNHAFSCKSKSPYKNSAAININDHGSKPRFVTFILLRNLTIENNFNNWATVSLKAGYLSNTKVDITIQDSIFRNNSVAFRVSSIYFTKGSPQKFPTILLENNTFINNVYQQQQINCAAAIFFGNGKHRVSSCRFLDNVVGENPYTGVVTISEEARATF